VDNCGGLTPTDTARQGGVLRIPVRPHSPLERQALDEPARCWLIHQNRMCGHRSDAAHPRPVVLDSGLRPGKPGADPAAVSNDLARRRWVRLGYHAPQRAKAGPCQLATLANISLMSSDGFDTCAPVSIRLLGGPPPVLAAQYDVDT